MMNLHNLIMLEENVKIGIFKIIKKEGGGIYINVDFDAIQNFIEKGIGIVFVFLIMYFGIKIGNKIIDKFVQRQIHSKINFSMNEQKALTIGAMLKSALKYGVYIIGGILIVMKFVGKVDAAVLGAVGFAVSIGAQSLVKDLINGFFILFEDQFGVGDHVTIGVYTGIVESIGIRTTSIRDFTGDLHVLTNGSILTVTNHSRGSIRFLVDVEIAYEENTEDAISLINRVCNKFKEQYAEDLDGEMEVLGVNSLNASGVTIRIIGRSKPLMQWKMERELRLKIKNALDEEGIEIPYPKTKLVK